MRPEDISQDGSGRGGGVPDEVIVGAVAAPHGVRGEMKVSPLTDDPRRFHSLKTVLLGDREYDVVSARLQGETVLLKLAGVETPETVNLLRRQYVRIRGKDVAPLPEGSYYHFELQGLNVVTTAGEPLGELVQVLPLASNDVYVVRGGRGEVLVPAIQDVVKEIDLEAGRIVIEPVPGLLPGEGDHG